MNLDELIATLPNGLHDLCLRYVVFNFAEDEVRLGLDVWVGDLDSDDPLVREKYLRAELRLNEIGLWIADGPPNLDELCSGDELMLNEMGRLSEDHVIHAALLPNAAVKPEHFLFVSRFNAIYYFTCLSATLDWAGE